MRLALALSFVLAATATARAQALAVTPSPLDFGTVAVGQTSSMPLSVANPDAMTAVGVTGVEQPTTTACDAFTVTPAPHLPDTIPPSTTRTWTIAFKPAAATAYDCSILVDDGAGNNDTIHVVGSGGDATLDAVPDPLAFGPVVVGTTADQVVTLRNTGTIAATLGTIAPPPKPFSLVNPPAKNTTIPPGGSITFTVRYAPTATGNAAATLAIPSNDPMSPYALALSGSGATAGGAVIAMSPSTVAFGMVSVGAIANGSFTISNTGTMELDVSALAITGANAADFSFADTALGCTSGQTCNAPFAVTPSGAPHTIALHCTPQAFGSRLATLTATSNASSGPSSIGLSCTGTAPSVHATPTSVDFGTVRVGTPRSAPVSIGNAGNVDLHVSSITLSGANAGDFAETGCALGCTVKAGGALGAMVTFTPAARGARAASLVVHSDDPAAPAYSVALAGTGGAGVLVITQPAGGAIDFGDIPVGVTSSPAPITIQNQGEIGLTISSLATSPSQFARGGPAAPMTIAAGTSATWQLTCTPTTVSTYTGKTTITSDALVDPTQSVSLACTGAVGSLVGDPAPVSFGAVRTDRPEKMTVAIKNVGGASVTVQSASVTSTDGVFTVAPQVALPHALAPGQTFAIDVTFAPQAQQTYMDKLVLTDADAKTALTVNLSGDGQIAAYTASPTSVDFGTLCVDQSASQDVTLSNTGSALIHVSSTRVTGSAFSIASGDVGAGADLAAGQTRTVTIVGVAPTGAATGQLTATTDLATGGTTQIPLSIAGAGDHVAANPTSIDFGQQPLEVAGPPEDVTIVNCSAAPLAISSYAIDGDAAGAFGAQGPASITLPIGGSQAWSVIFTAKQDGGAAATLAFTTDQAPLAIPLHGTGADASGADGGAGATPNTYYGCACRSGGSAGGAAPLLVVIAAALRRRRPKRARPSDAA